MSNIQVVPVHLSSFRYALEQLVVNVVAQKYKRTRIQMQYMLDEEKVPKTENHCKCVDAHTFPSKHSYTLP